MPSETTERWQNKVTSLKDGIQKIYENKEFSDVVFRVGRKQYKAHRLILAARCSELARILLDTNAVDEIVVENDAVTETGFEILLRFIYMDDLGTNDKKSIVKAFLAADCYKQRKLMQKCEEHIDTWSISVDEVCELLNVSIDIPRLKERCLDFIKNNALDVISSPTFFNLNYKALVAILENDAFRDVPIERRIERIVEWGAHMHTSPVDYALVRDDFLNQTPPLLGLMRLDELPTLQEFSKLFVVQFPKLLIGDELVKFMAFFASNKTNRAALPDWCTTA